MLVSVTKPIGRFFQQPWEVKRYRIVYSTDLAEGEIISELTFLVDNETDPELDITNGAIAPDGDQVTFFVGGGLTGNTYKVSARVTTNAGQQFEHELEFVIQER